MKTHTSQCSVRVLPFEEDALSRQYDGTRPLLDLSGQPFVEPRSAPYDEYSPHVNHARSD